MNRVLRSGLALCAGFGLTAAAIALSDRDRHDHEVPGAKLGVLEMNDYCRRAYGDRARAVHPGDGAYGWRCWRTTNGLIDSTEISMDVACEVMYGKPAYAQSHDFGSPFSWECFRGPQPSS